MQISTCVRMAVNPCPVVTVRPGPAPTREYSDFGRWLQAEFDRRGWSRARFAADADISPNLVPSLLYRPTRPKADTCLAIARGLGLPLYRVLEAAGLPWDGLAGIPCDDVRRQILARVERMTDKEAADLLKRLCPTTR